jgi:hypothetical protein
MGDWVASYPSILQCILHSQGDFDLWWIFGLELEAKAYITTVLRSMGNSTLYSYDSVTFHGE